MREMDEALDDWDRYMGIPLEKLLREAFQILGEARLIDDDLARELSDLAGFRNILVHIYWGLDMEMVYHILQNDRKHLINFRDEVKRILCSRSSGGE
jgi:uncharacterized protein YutE (UPF0331/DUF86 family)